GRPRPEEYASIPPSARPAIAEPAAFTRCVAAEALIAESGLAARRAGAVLALLAEIAREQIALEARRVIIAAIAGKEIAARRLGPRRRFTVISPAFGAHRPAGARVHIARDHPSVRGQPFQP